MDQTSFEAELHAAGYTDIVARDMEAGRFNAEHTHEFDARGLITGGEFTLTCAGEPRVLHAGDVFEMAAGTPHTELCGAGGASYVVGRRYK